MIDSFKGPYAFLSNFHPSLVGGAYPTVEHAFQAAKTRDPEQRAKVATCATPAQAKRLGRKVTLRPDWEDVKLDVMEELLRQKFENPDLLTLLRATAPHELVEGNTWGDTYWGVCRGKGRNHLGKLLMKIRGD